MRSVVRWGTVRGNLTEREEQDHQLVYTYVYGPGKQGQLNEEAGVCLCTYLHARRR